MKKEEINNKLDEELKHIPRSTRGSKQNMFRFCYYNMRRHSLGNNPICPAKDILIEAVVEMKKSEPNFSPIYDRQFFHIYL
jgi:hypothetical protein